MGATWFEVSGNGPSLNEAYIKLVELAENEHGHDSYNGTISTTHNVKDETEMYKKSKFTSVDAYINSRSTNMGKRDCSAICLQEPKANTNKTKSQVEHIVTPGTKQWILKYEVEHHYGDSGVIASCPQKGDAVKAARAYTERTQIPTVIIIRKVLVGPKPVVAKITYKKSNTERPGKWVFFGYAAE